MVRAWTIGLLAGLVQWTVLDQSSVLDQRSRLPVLMVYVGYTSVAVTACETDHYILVVFVVMSKEEGLCTVESLISQ